MRIIAFANQKGGVGKTTTVVNVGAALAELKKKVLVVDLDPQAHLTKSLGVDSGKLEESILDVLKAKSKWKDTVIETRGLSVIPSTPDLAGIDVELGGVIGREKILKKAFAGITGYDYILIDCPPSLGILTLNALVCSTDIFVALQTHYYALDGMAEFVKVVRTVQEVIDKGVEITGIIFTLHSPWKNLNQEIEQETMKHFGNLVFKTAIRENIKLAEAPSHQKTIFEYAPSSHGAEDYMALAKEIIKKTGK